MNQAQTPQSPVDGEQQAPENEVQSLLDHPLAKKAMEYQKPLLAGVAAVLVIIAAVSGYNAWQESAAADARNQLARTVEKAITSQDLTLLESYMETAPDSVRMYGYMELARLSVLMDDKDVAEDAWRKAETAAKDQAPELVAVARLGLAKAMLDNGKAAEAHALLANASGMGEAYAAPALRIRARAAEMAGMKAEALAAYEEMSSLGGDDANFGTAKVAELSGNPQ